MASLDIRRLGLGAMALIGASLVFKGVKGKEISKKEEDNLALEIGIDSVMGAETLEAESNFDAVKKLKKRWEESFRVYGITYEEMLVGEINRLRDRLKMKGFDPDAKIGSPKYAESFEVETSSKGFLKENLPDSKEERLKDLKEDLEYRERVLSQFKKLEASLMPFTTGMVRHLPKMEDKMLEFLYYAKQNMKHYTKLVAETQEQMQQIKGAESFDAEYDEVIDELMDSSFLTMDYTDIDIEHAKEDLIENIESGFIVPVEKLKQRLKNAGFKKAKTFNEGDYGTFHIYEPIELDGVMLTMQLVENSSGGGERIEFIPSGYGLLGSNISTYASKGDMTISELNKKMDKIEPLMRKIGLLKKGDTIKREHDYSESEHYCEYKFPSLVGLSDKELGISMIEWDEEKGDLLLTLELNDGIDKKYAYISTPLKRDDFVSHKDAESFEAEA
tara:strand:- start:2459 stop:3796 length:1338 start_codon:yes stop_codon:yes gene_type:complete